MSRGLVQYEEKFEGRVFQVLFRTPDTHGVYPKKPSGMIVKVMDPIAPCIMWTATGEALDLIDAQQVINKMALIDHNPPTPPEPKRRRNATKTTPRGPSSSGVGKYTPPKKVVVSLQDLKVGDILTGNYEGKINLGLKDASVSSHKKKGRSGRIKLIHKDGSTEALNYGLQSPNADAPVEVLRPPTPHQP